MTDDNKYTIIYAAIVGTICAVLLTAAAQLTAPLRQANALAERNRNILISLGVPFDSQASSAQLVEIYDSNVKVEDKAGLSVYSYIRPDGDDVAEAIAVHFEGQGLWGPIKGFLATQADMKTIRGITFYQQQETPGLGAEIASEGFRNRFKGKSIFDGEGKVGIVIRHAPPELGQNEVDGIAGATITCDKVQQMINAAIEHLTRGNDNDE